MSLELRGAKSGARDKGAMVGARAKGAMGATSARTIIISRIHLKKKFLPTGHTASSCVSTEVSVAVCWRR